MVAGVAIDLIRSRGEYRSLPNLLAQRYGAECVKPFVLPVPFRLLNKVWSNTKVMSL